MTTDAATTQSESQDQQQPVLETKKHKTRGTLTTTPGTFSECERIIEERGFAGRGAHERLVVDFMNHDATAHQMYELLEPLAPELGTEQDAHVATLKALVAAYLGGGRSGQKGVAQVLQLVGDEPDPVAYLTTLVERDRKFQAALQNRSSKVDVTTASMEDLRTKIKTPEAATERFRRAVNAIIRHNDAQTDPLHFWYINSAALRDLVGGRNEAAQQYIQSRQAEIDEHHAKYSLTPKHNKKTIEIQDDVTVE